MLGITGIVPNLIKDGISGIGVIITIDGIFTGPICGSSTQGNTIGGYAGIFDTVGIFGITGTGMFGRTGIGISNGEIVGVFG